MSGKSPKSEHELVEVLRPEDIPVFANEDEVHAFWSTHCIGPAYVARVGRIPEGTFPLPPIRQERSPARGRE